MTLLDQLERLRAEALQATGFEALIDAQSAWVCALNDSAPLLLAAVRAAEARPWWHEDREGYRWCCACGNRDDIGHAKDPACRFAPLDAALDQLKEPTR